MQVIQGTPEQQLGSSFDIDQLTMHELAASVRVLVGCELSGTAREAFLALGFDAWSCDLLPDENRSNRHMQCDIRDVLDVGWDFLTVMHPPCTRLCNSGVRWLTGKNGAPPKKLPKGKTLEQLWQELDEGAALFSDCWNADIPSVCVENPQMHKYVKQRIRNIQTAEQHVQPWWFGDPAFKSTWLYLKGLPALVPTNKLAPPEKDTPEHKAWSAIHRASPSKDRTKIRSKTFQGVVDAIADQWGDVVIQARLAEIA